ncbi:ArpU family phage packaging/lysis transcriptional regulator [Priestia flexa]|uniref:ArpU family transcriptional regulator n=2 Tax=Priestia TaxID=2800373 RepID=A0A0V8JRW4_9BACI|nr:MULTISPECIES: ArpU family phage packaging/lysis transcriptional regulator [Priestia]KSU89823.1 ArpU family transcriptional regulator [Priestia veravalensis]MBN8434708.1 ArpU family transcriptional regulator [Priestia flexa]MCA0967247.1 ArpU family transcriptional regulator [Priestia flexa]MDW8515835.1 ArpU family phage packaging/lysis transcriptional regulator [Priestia flexa]MEC0664495.1 ArpU family phage packaging/lysis transcriptional regulator [Priestia flexa]
MMDTLLPEIDVKATKRVVEAALEKYRVLLLTQNEEELPKVTATYSLVPPSNTNAFHSSTEDIAIRNISHEQARSKYLKRMVMAVNRLGYWERAILIQRYMLQDDVFDYQVYNDLNFSERKYYRLKEKAFIKLALSLRIEVYKEGDDK